MNGHSKLFPNDLARQYTVTPLCNRSGLDMNFLRYQDESVWKKLLFRRLGIKNGEVWSVQLTDPSKIQPRNGSGFHKPKSDRYDHYESPTPWPGCEITLQAKTSQLKKIPDTIGDTGTVHFYKNYEIVPTKSLCR